MRMRWISAPPGLINSWSNHPPGTGPVEKCAAKVALPLALPPASTTCPAAYATLDFTASEAKRMSPALQGEVEQFSGALTTTHHMVTAWPGSRSRVRSVTRAPVSLVTEVASAPGTSTTGPCDGWVWTGADVCRIGLEGVTASSPWASPPPDVKGQSEHAAVSRAHPAKVSPVMI